MTRAKLLREHQDCFGHTHPAGTTGRLMGAFGVGAERRVVFKLPVAPEGGSRILTVLEREVEELVDAPLPSPAPGAVGDVISPGQGAPYEDVVFPPAEIPPWLSTQEDVDSPAARWSPVPLLLGLGLIGWFALSVALYAR